LGLTFESLKELGACQLGLAFPSKTFYRFIHKELEELKSQINDSMERNYIMLGKVAKYGILMFMDKKDNKL
jgi:hypothetical protein